MSTLPHRLLDDLTISHFAFRLYHFIAASTGPPPTQHQLAERFDTSIKTVQRALAELQSGDYLTRHQFNGGETLHYHLTESGDPLPEPPVIYRQPVVPKGTGIYGQSFKMIFWPAYPRKTAVDAALSAWLRLRPDERMLNQIMMAIQTQYLALRYADADLRRYVPAAAPWLRDGQFKDDPAYYRRYDPVTELATIDAERYRGSNYLSVRGAST